MSAETVKKSNSFPLSPAIKNDTVKEVLPDGDSTKQANTGNLTSDVLETAKNVFAGKKGE